MSEDKEAADPFLANAREILAKADAELSEQKRFESELPERPFITGVASFLLDPQTALNWGVFTIWSFVLSSLLKGVFHFADAGMMQIASIALLVVFAVMGLPFMLWFLASCLAITRDSANGLETIDSWPSLDITECMSVAPFMLLSLAAAIFPGYIVGQGLLLSDASTWTMFAVCTATLLLIYPVVLLSMVKSGSPLALLSSPVLQSMNSSLGTWLRFYLLSGSLGALVALFVWLNWIAGFIFGFLCAVPMIALTMIYHRLMGRLAWVIQTRSEEISATKSSDD